VIILSPAEETMTLADRLEAKALSLNLPPIDCGSRHHFGCGVYIREVTIPAGTYVIGHAHKGPHLCNMLAGTLAFVDENGGPPTVITAPATFVAPAGRKVAFVVEDCVFQNIFATDLTDVDELERLLVTKSPAFVAHEAARALVPSSSMDYSPPVLLPEVSP